MTYTLSTELLERLAELHPETVQPVSPASSRTPAPFVLLATPEEDGYGDSWADLGGGRGEVWGLALLRLKLEEWIEAKGWWVDYERGVNLYYANLMPGKGKLFQGSSPHNYTEAAGWAYIRALEAE